MDRGSRFWFLLSAFVLLVSGCAAAGSAPHRTVIRRVTLGHSVEGRPIGGYRVGDLRAPRRLLAVGCIHGNESAGEAISRQLRALPPAAGVLLWVVDEFNPDGCATDTRQNAHGVDLNRNSPWHWRPLNGIFYSGPRPLSEPESRAINRLVRCVQPQVSIWYHQSAALVDDSGGARSIERRYARLTGLPFRHFGLEPGSITGWQNAVFPNDTAFVVELPGGRLSRRAVARHVSAVEALAREIAPRPVHPRPPCPHVASAR